MGISITALKSTAYSDLTGQFPHMSSRGNKYLLTIYDHDANTILAGPLKIIQAKEISMVWEKEHLQLTKNDHTVNISLNCLLLKSQQGCYSHRGHK